MNNPLPVDRFSVADAARRTWPHLIESMLEAICLIEPEGLRIVAANGPAGRLLGVPAAELVGRDMHGLAATPEDECFWREVAENTSACIVSDSFVARPGGIGIRRSVRAQQLPPTALDYLSPSARVTYFFEPSAANDAE